MKALGKRSYSAVLSLLCGLVVTFLFVGYGITDEVPVGSISGTVKMSENDKPLPKAFVTITRIIHDDLYEDEDIATEHHFRADKSGRFQLNDILAGRYKIEVSTRAHKCKQIIDIVEGKATPVDLEAAPIPPYLDMYASQRVYMPQETPKVQVHGFSHETQLKTTIYKLDYDKVIKDGGLYAALAPLARPSDDKIRDPATLGVATNTFEVPLSERDAEGTFRFRLPLQPLAEGLYWIRCQAGDLTKGTWLSITKIALVTKSDPYALAAYVTKLDTGEPVSGASVGFSTTSGLSKASTTGKDGLVQLVLPAKNSGDSEVVVASAGDSRAIVDFQRTSPNDTEDESDEGDAAYSETRIYCYTDRPIYRPGDLIQYKGIVRHLHRSTYELPKKTQVKVDFTDGSGTVLQSEDLAISSLGSYHGQFQLSPESLPDNYSIVTHYGGVTDSKDVGVAAYRKPTFSITVQAEKKSYVRGETARMDVQAKYYYGAPVVGATVTATVSRDEYFPPYEEDEYGQVDSGEKAFPGQSVDSEGGGELTQQITATTDENGKAVIAFPTVGASESKEAALDYDYTVTVSIKDASDKQYTGSGDVVVLRSSETMELETDPLVVMAGDAFNVKATLKKGDGSPAAGTSVRFTSGFVAYTKKGEEVLTDKQFGSANSDAGGLAGEQLQPQGQGEYEVEAEFTDDRGHPVSETAYVYLYSEKPLAGWQENGPQEDLSVLLDKKHYNVGDTAKAIIRCKNPGGTALVAIEGSLIHKVETVKLDSHATLYSFKVLNDYSPDVFVSVAYVKDKVFAQDQRQVIIDLGIKKLSVSLTSDKPVYHPGDTATYTVTTKDATGAPVSAELSLGVVDESIYSIFDDQSDIVKAFYPKREDDIQTNYSFPDLYLGGGDKAPTNIQVRRKFQDTAAWSPVVETTKAGTATVSVKLPDNITSWRTTVRAITAGTEVGQTTENVVARKDLMIQLSAPAYVVKGDDQRMVAMVTNNTGKDADVHVSLQATNAKVAGDLNTTVHIANGAMQTIEYKVATVDTGEASFVGKAWVSSGASDGMELKLPVRPHARLVTDGFGGLTNSSKDISFDLQPSADPNTGGLEIDVSPTIAASLVSSVNELVDYPYGCVEQTTSRFLPTVILAKTYSQIGLPSPKLSKKIPDIVRDSYQRLKAMQHADGGWGWWEYDSSDPHMTAYVLEALYRAKQAGYPAPSEIDAGKAMTWADAYLKDGKISTEYGPPSEGMKRQFLTDKIYLAYALLLNGHFGQSQDFIDAQFKVLGSLDAAQAALCAMAVATPGYLMASSNVSDLSKKTNTPDRALARMFFLAKETKSTLYWPEEDWWGYETTARCFQAMETVAPTNPKVEKVVTYLLQSRRGDMWYSTRDTAVILLPMVDYLSRTKELLSSSYFTITVNGRQVSEVKYTQGVYPDKPTAIRLHISDLKPGKVDVRFDAKSGVCYYAATLKQYDASEEMPAIPEDNQLTVSRDYYRLEARRMEDGTLKLMPSRQPITDYKSGDIIECVLKIHTDANREYVFVEDPTPSGLHVTDRETPDDGDAWAFWWSRTVILDDRVCLFARDVKAGDSQMSYVMQAENPGSCSALPTAIYNMYDASDAASSAGLALNVGE